MKKLSLNIEQLQVDSYETDGKSNRERGTVWGNNSHTNTTRTYDFSCAGSTCFANCAADPTTGGSVDNSLVAPWGPGAEPADVE